MGRMFELALLVVGLVMSNAVHAHMSAQAHGSFDAGLMHPFTGLDHFLAMFAVGLWAVRSGGQTLVLLPGVFVTAMAIGAAAGVSEVPLPVLEGATGFSVLLLGGFLAFAVRAGLRWAVPLTAAFALCHGYAHGVEMPAFANLPAYFAGFLLATALLHAAGVLGGELLREQPWAVKAGGAAISLAGAWLVFGA